MLTFLNRAFRILYFFLLLTAFSAGTGLFADQASSQAIEPRFVKKKSFVQVYTFSAMFDDTTLIQAQFTLTNLGISNRNAACRILVLHKTAGQLCYNEKFGRNEWSYSGGLEQSLELGSNRILIRDSRTSISIVNDKIKADITFECMPAAVFTPGAGISVNGRFFEYALLIPWAEAHAVIERPGNPLKRLSGFGMLEMSRSTSLPSDICRGWISFRGYNAGSNFLVNLRIPPGEGIQAPGWIWRSPRQSACATTGLLIGPGGPETLQNKLIVRQIAALDKSFSIEPQILLFRYSFIDELGPVLGAIVRLVIGYPVTYYYEATAQSVENSQAIPGVLEFMRIE